MQYRTTTNFRGAKTFAEGRSPHTQHYAREKFSCFIFVVGGQISKMRNLCSYWHRMDRQWEWIGWWKFYLDSTIESLRVPTKLLLYPTHSNTHSHAKNMHMHTHMWEGFLFLLLYESSIHSFLTTIPFSAEGDKIEHTYLLPTPHQEIT